MKPRWRQNYLPFLTLLLCCLGMPVSAQPWQSPLRQSHPLVGQIHDLRNGQTIGQEQLLALLADAPILLLGEKHDNPDHHALRLALLETLLQNGTVHLVAMEMLDSTQQTLVDALPDDAWRDPADLPDQLQWQQGWHWDFYAPVLQQVLRHDGVALRAANLSRDEVMQVYQGELPAAAAERLTPQQLLRLEADLDDSHCGLLPASQLPAMLRVQQARDLRMAQSIAADAAGQRILLAGNYHVRHDLGVSNYLPAGTGDVISVAFLEVSDQALAPADYFDPGVAGVLPWDIIWFTPALSDEDYCDALR